MIAILPDTRNGGPPETATSLDRTVVGAHIPASFDLFFCPCRGVTLCRTPFSRVPPRTERWVVRVRAGFREER